MSEKRPLVGVGILIIKDNRVLLAKRKGSHGEGEYAFPGGHLEFGESFSDCAIRETSEEAGIQISDIEFQFLANIIKYDGKQYVHVGLTAKWLSGDPQNLEPNKSEDWGWHKIEQPPKPLFEMSRLAIESLNNGQIYYDLA